MSAVATLEATARSALGRQLRAAQAGRSMLHPVIGRSRRFEAWAHYPRDDVVDASGHWQFYFHAHDAQHARRHPLEIGHFHLFRRDAQARLTHVTGLAMGARGEPLRWFATNQWVTGEHWQDADVLVPLLAQAQIRTAGPLAGTAAWLGELVQLYAAPLARMLLRRDQALARHCARSGCTAQEALHNRRVAVWSTASVRWPDDAVRLAGCP